MANRGDFEEPMGCAGLVRSLLGNIPFDIGLVVGILAGKAYVDALSLPSHEFGSPSGILVIMTLLYGGAAGFLGLLLLVPEPTRGFGQALLIALGAAAVSWFLTILILPR